MYGKEKTANMNQNKTCNFIQALKNFSEQMTVNHLEWRKGQSLINCAEVCCPHLCKNISGTENDCFYEDSRIPRFLAYVNTKLRTSVPFVGIFWFYQGITLFPHAVPLEKGLPYGNAITGTKDHADYWDSLSSGQLSFLPDSFREEYFSIPRGRVVYHSDTDKFFVYHGNNLKKKDLRLVAEAFCLPKEKTVFEKDLHYCDYDEKSWETLMGNITI